MADAPEPNVPFPPMEAELVSELPSGAGWRYEPKWDGFRGVLENDGGELALWSRNGRPLLRYCFFDVIGHPVKFLGADHQINMGNAVEERRSAGLGHAAQEPENHVRTLPGHPSKHPHFAKRFLVCHVAHAAGVQQDDIGVLLAIHSLVTPLNQRIRDLLRIAFIHLAAVGFDEELGHKRPKIIHRPGRLATRPPDRSML